MYRNKITLALTSLLFFSFLSWNCTKIDTTTIGNGLIPAVDNVNTFETFLDVAANTIDTSADCTSLSQLQDYALGTISSDPLFGKSSATIYTELGPTVFPFILSGTNANRKLDSVVLVLNYKSMFGDSSVQQKLDVFEVSPTSPSIFFKPDTSSCMFYPYLSLRSLGTKTFIPNSLKDSSKALRDTTVGTQLRIKLNAVFADRLIRDSSIYLSDSAFKIFFKGFAIVPDTAFGGNALMYLSVSDPNTKLAIYYRYPKDTGGDTSTVNYLTLATSSYSANYIKRNRNGSEEALHKTIIPGGDNVVYVQTTPGVAADLQIPALTTLSNRFIHRAELIMDQVYTGSKFDIIFPPPGVLYIDIKNSAATSFKPIPCDLNTFAGTPNISTFGGIRTIVKDQFGNKISRYTFNISRYVQKVVSKVLPNVPFRLRAPDYFYNATGYVDECGQTVSPLFSLLNTISVGRVKLGGGNNTNYKMKLHIVYSNL